MTNETNNKLAAILAAQQAKAKVKTTTAFKAVTPTPAQPAQPVKPTPAPVPQPKPAAQPQVSAPVDNNLPEMSNLTFDALMNIATMPVTDQGSKEVAPAAAPAKLSSFTIIWHEGTGEFDGKTVTTWKEANDIMTKIYNQHTGLGYTKVKICVGWLNGSEIIDRADCSDSAGDFCPKRGTIGQYLKEQNNAMYKSNIVGKRAELLSFEDDSTPATPKAEDLTFVDYSAAAFAITGNTYPFRKILAECGGKYNKFLKCGEGWIFSKKRYYTVRVKLSLVPQP